MSSGEAAVREVAIFDLDGTITDCDTYVKFLRLCLRRQPARVLRSLHLPAAVLLFKARIHDNAWLKNTFLKALAGGCDPAALTAMVDAHVRDIVAHHLRPAALEQIEKHRHAGHTLLLATASFDFYVEQLGQRLGFDTVVCTKALRGHDESLVGIIDGQNCYGVAKAAAIRDALPERQQCTITAYTDHHSDWPLLIEADNPVAVSPTPQLRRLARERGIEILDW